MDPWIPITIAAAFFQSLRSALQKHLKGLLSTTGATFSRFAYAAPLALLYLLALASLTGADLPTPNPTLPAPKPVEPKTSALPAPQPGTTVTAPALSGPAPLLNPFAQVAAAQAAPAAPATNGPKEGPVEKKESQGWKLFRRNK